MGRLWSDLGPIKKVKNWKIETRESVEHYDREFPAKGGEGGKPFPCSATWKKKIQQGGEGRYATFCDQKNMYFWSNTLFLALLVGGHCYNLSERAWGGTPYSTIFFRKQHLQKGEDTPCRIMQLGIWRAPPWQRQRLTYRWFMGRDDMQEGYDRSDRSWVNEMKHCQRQLNKETVTSITS